MKTITNAQLLDELSADTRGIILFAEQLKARAESEMIRQRNDGGWSAAQVLYHLNVYSQYYLPAIEKAISGNPPSGYSFKPGLLGNYFTGLMGTDASGMVKKKMKSPKNAVPPPVIHVKESLNEFLQHQHHLLNLLEIVRSVHLGKVRIPVSIAKFIRMKLGDTLRFYIEHEKRHVKQMERVLEITSPRA